MTTYSKGNAPHIRFTGTIEYSLNNFHAVTPAEKNPEVVAMRKSGYSKKYIAEILHMSQDTVKNILNEPLFLSASPWFDENGQDEIDFIIEHNGKYSSSKLRDMGKVSESNLATITFKCGELWEDDNGRIHWGYDGVDKQTGDMVG